MAQKTISELLEMLDGLGYDKYLEARQSPNTGLTRVWIVKSDDGEYDFCKDTGKKIIRRRYFDTQDLCAEAQGWDGSYPWTIKDL